MLRRLIPALLLLTASRGALAEPAIASTPAPHSSPLSRAVSGGALLFAASYALMLYFPVRDRGEGSSTWLTVPFAGPALAAHHGFDEVQPWGLAFDSLGQVAGTALIVSGLALGERYRDPPVASASGDPLLASASSDQGKLVLRVRGRF